ncbi:histidine phosphatase family protein [Shouchella clausii]|uniref:Histidine phosphatase family protein n=1 Tax=Shouchella clausii TaxID=79880 RepID=A0A268RVE3_SHOCL|nr:histidine phosphatase family protein [Shouchella clausii]PAD41156.1 histidine phosphatase family protein [Bacillus sp. 7520-S]AST98411.1 histidine phosphatase family protein [Shouchella clausii]MBU8597885.1 histidine phosphatase family protein [Shouchella clausii]MCM3548182.1 histidine phosphatase family protein [Shouchella clausii]MEB5472918.1 histidine phosphatase family protein [Shouchella clausii]
MKLYMIRHGESEGNRLGKIQGSMDFPLSDLGKKQAQAVAHFCTTLAADYLYTSDLTRAANTAQAISEATQLPSRKWELLREVNLGPLQGLTRSEIAERFPETTGKPLIASGIEGTESALALTERCYSLLSQLKKAHRDDESVILVSHGGFISCLLMYAIVGEQWAAFERPFIIGNTSVTLLEWKEKDERYLLHYTNRTAHLETVRADLTAKHGLL